MTPSKVLNMEENLFATTEEALRASETLKKRFSKVRCTYYHVHRLNAEDQEHCHELMQRLKVRRDELNEMVAKANSACVIL